MKKIFSLIILVTGAISSARAQSYNWNGKNGDLLIGPYVQIYYDSSGTDAIEGISKPSTLFQPPIKNFDYITDVSKVHWLKFNIQNNTDKSLMLELGRVEIKSAILYSKDSTGKWQSQKAGYQVNLFQKPYLSHYQVFKLNSVTGEYFLRIQSVFNAFAPLSIWEAASLEHRAAMQKIISGVCNGVMIFVMLYNLFLYFSLRRLYFLFYAFLVYNYLSHSLFEGGEIFYFFPGVNFEFLYPRVAMFAAFFATIFGVSFLNVKENAPRWVYIVTIIAICQFGSFGLWHMFLSTNNIMNFNALHSLEHQTWAMTIGIVVGRKNRMGYWFFAAYVLLSFSIVLSIMNYSTGNPASFWGIAYSNIGILLETIILAYLVSLRFKAEQKQKEYEKKTAKNELYNQMLQNEKIIRNQNVLLENTVALRTEQLRNLLDEKEGLLKEIHHRIKNNLEVISSLLMLQTDNITDEKARAALEEGQSRVQSIALIHHKLYRTDDLASVEMKGFAIDLFKQVLDVYKKPGYRIKFDVGEAEMTVDTDTAVPLGLILNELFTNVFKYAVMPERDNMISLQFTELKMPEATNYKLVFRDNGNGVPADFNIEQTSSIGMKVVRILTKQLKGSLNYYYDNGAVFEIDFSKLI